MKVLMISSYLPFPLHSGGHVRLYNLIKELSAHHEITLVCEKRSHQSESDINEVKKICKKVLTVERRKQWSLENIAVSVLSSRSFLSTGHTSSKMHQIINDELNREQFDIIHVETFYIMQNLPSTNLPVVLAEHNIEYQVYQRFADRMLFIKPFLSIDIAKIKKEEEAAWKRADKLVAVSQDDKKIMEQLGHTPLLVANGVDLSEFRYKNVDKFLKQIDKKVLFIGDFKWLQNRDTAKWIIKDIWPKISSKFKMQNSKLDAKLWIVGRSIPDALRNLTNDSDVIFDEDSSVKPASQIFQEAYALLSPIRVGGGTSYKILESMASGTPVITMNMSAKSIMAKDGDELLVGEDENELAAKVDLLFNDTHLYKKISYEGRQLIEERYSWKEIAKELDRVYRETVN